MKDLQPSKQTTAQSNDWAGLQAVTAARAAQREKDHRAAVLAATRESARANKARK
jgi:hypothetical protein